MGERRGWPGLFLRRSFTPASIMCATVEVRGAGELSARSGRRRSVFPVCSFGYSATSLFRGNSIGGRFADGTRESAGGTRAQALARRFPSGDWTDA